MFVLINIMPLVLLIEQLELNRNIPLSVLTIKLHTSAVSIVILIMINVISTLHFLRPL